MNALYLISLFCGIASAQVLETIGDVFPVQFRSNGVSDIRGTETPLGTSYKLSHPGATYIAIHFAELNLLEGDTIEVSDVNGGQAYTLVGSGKGQGSAFWSQHIKGEAIVLNTIVANKSADRSSIFAVDKYAAGYEALTETICGSDDKANAVCYASSFPTEYSKSKAVARLLVNGVTPCSGFLVSGSNHLLTSNNCIKNAADALNTDYEFMSEAPLCNLTNSQNSHKGTIFGGATFIKTNTDLDYTLVQINNGNPANVFGFLELDDQPAVAGAQIYIPQHPNGKAKQLAMFSTHTADASDGFCHINKVGNMGCGGSVGNNLFYFCDTEGGSAGSPVLARSTNKVVGLHKCGGCANGNHATSSHLIWNEASTLLSPLAPSNPAPTTAPVQAPTSVESPAPTPIASPTAPTGEAPFATPTPPVRTPVSSPVKPVCLISKTRCTSGSRCCSGVCRINRRCR